MVARGRIARRCRFANNVEFVDCMLAVSKMTSEKYRSLLLRGSGPQLIRFFRPVGVHIASGILIDSSVFAGLRLLRACYWQTDTHTDVMSGFIVAAYGR